MVAKGHADNSEQLLCDGQLEAESGVRAQSGNKYRKHSRATHNSDACGWAQQRDKRAATRKHGEWSVAYPFKVVEHEPRQ